jgi:transposase
MENNSAERELKAVAVGRRAWLFYGSDDHAGAAGNTLSLIASCKIPRLDPSCTSPRSSASCRTGPATVTSPEELELPLGHITVPPPPPKEQPSSN